MPFKNIDFKALGFFCCLVEVLNPGVKSESYRKSLGF